MKLSSGTLLAVAAVAMLSALAHAQVGWRRDRVMYDSLVDRYRRLQLHSTFLAAGDHISESPLVVVRDRDTVSLATAFEETDGAKLVLFGRNGCNACDWFSARMDSISSTWMDSVLYISTSDSVGLRDVELRVDSAGARMIPAVPLLLVLDRNGRVTNSAVGLKRMLNVLEDLRVQAPSFEQLKSERIAPATQSTSTDTLKRL